MANGDQTPAEARQDETAQRARTAFLEALRKGASVAGAAAHAGVGRATVYRWAKDDEAFAAEWDDAYETGTDVLEEEAIRRGAQGVERFVVSKGMVVMHEGAPLKERHYSDTLLSQQLAARRPAKYRTNHKVEHTGGVKLTIAPDDDAL